MSGGAIDPNIPQKGWFAKLNPSTGAVLGVRATKGGGFDYEIVDAPDLDADDNYTFQLKDKDGNVVTDNTAHTTPKQKNQGVLNDEDLNKQSDNVNSLINDVNDVSITNNEHAKNLIEMMLSLKGTKEQQKVQISELLKKLNEIYQDAEKIDKTKIFELFKNEYKERYSDIAKTNKPDSSSDIKSIHTILVGKDAQIKFLNGILNNNSAADKIASLNITRPQPAAPAPGIPKEFTYTPPAIPEPNVNSVRFRMRLPNKPNNTLATNRLIVEATKQGKGKKASDAKAFDAKDGFDMNIICDKLELVIKNANTEFKTPNYRGIKPSKRVNINNRITQDQRDLDDAHKHKLFGAIASYGVVTDPNLDPKKNNTYEIHAGTATNSVVLKAELTQTTNPTTKVDEEELHIVANCSDLNHDVFSNKDFDTTSDIGQRQAAVAGGLPKLIRKTADIIGADSADVYIEQAGTPGPMAANNYTKDDLEKLIIAATTAFAAHVYPLIDDAVWTNAKAYIKNPPDVEFTRMFEALKAGLGIKIQNDDYKDAVKEFVTKFAAGTAYEDAAARDINPRGP